MAGLVQRIDDMIEQRSLLRHPFYLEWSEGKLSREALAGYSKEYYELVKAVPGFMDSIMERAPAGVMDELRANRQEEHDHIRYWVGFAGALGIDEDELAAHRPLQQTADAVDGLSQLMGSYEEGACAMYSFEKEIPKISRTKLDGLAEFYGISDGRATEYFELHTEADIRHAASWRGILEDAESEEDRLAGVADRSISAQHLLLDGCYEAYCRAM